MQVAYDLGDNRIDEWVELAAASLAQMQPAVASGSKRLIDELSKGLSLLSDKLQIAVFKVLVSNPCRLSTWIELLPSHHRPALVAATITPGKTLRATFCDENYAVLKALGAIPASPASLLSLHAHEQKSTDRYRPTQKRMMAEDLAQALRHHSSLTSLHICASNLELASVKLLLPAVASLTSLQSLHLGAEQSYFPVECVPMLQQTLPSLPHLEDLSFCIRPSPECFKRSRDADTGEPCPCCLTTAIAPATRLTSLHMCIDTQLRCNTCFTANAPLRLPHLKKLTAMFTNWHWTNAFISLLSAPLTTLVLDDQSSSFSSIRACCSVAHFQTFLKSLATFQRLRCLKAQLPEEARHKSGATSNGPQTFGEVMSTVPTVLASFQHLQELELLATSAALQQVALQLDVAQTALSHLRLLFRRPLRLGPTPALWPGVCSRLCRLPLTHLDLSLVTHASVGLSALRPLTQLSYLRTTGWRCLATAADCDALAGMTGLRSLSLIDCHDTHNDFVRVLLASSALTSVTLNANSRRFDADLVAALRAHPTELPWPALQELRLTIAELSLGNVADRSFGSAEALVRCAVELPSLKSLTMVLRGDPEPCNHDEISEDDRSSDHSSGSDGEGQSDYECTSHNTDSRQAAIQKVLSRIAADAGLDLSLEWPDVYAANDY